MSSTGLFHFYLYLAIGRIHIVKLFFARSSQIEFFLRIKEFVEMEQGALATQEQTEIVKAGIAVVSFTVARSILL